MNLSKKDKKIARMLIDKGLQKEFENGLNEFYEILHNWKSSNSETKETYYNIYQSVKEFDKHIAQRYDNLGGSNYFYTVLALLKDKIIAEADLSDFSTEIKQKIKSLLNDQNNN